jgi:hypothetical protein
MNVSDFSVGSIQNGWNGNLANEIGHDFRPRALSRGANKQARAAHHRRVMEAGRLIADVMSGKVNPIFLQEAMQPSDQIFVDWMRENYPGIYPQGSFALQETMSVTDYQALFVDVLDRLYYSYFNGFPVVNMPVVRFHDLRDFRLVSRYLLDGLVTPFTQMDAAAPPPAQSLSPVRCRRTIRRFRRPIRLRFSTSRNWRRQWRRSTGAPRSTTIWASSAIFRNAFRFRPTAVSRISFTSCTWEPRT